ncbi:MAG: outer membrane protein [Limisphaerales bacterium]
MHTPVQLLVSLRRDKSHNMKNRPLLSRLLAPLLAFPVLAHAQGENIERGTYARFGAGIAIVEDIEGFAADLFNPRIDFDLNLDPGVRLDFSPGYNFNNFVGVELNAGFLWNSLDGFETSAGSISAEGDLLQIPVLGSVVLRYPTPAGLTPFIGAGGGGTYVRLDFDHDGQEAGDDFFAAYQLLGGVRYQIDEGLSMGLVYKYLHVFSEDEETLVTGESSGLGDITSHSISAVAVFEF